MAFFAHLCPFSGDKIRIGPGIIVLSLNDFNIYMSHIYGSFFHIHSLNFDLTDHKVTSCRYDSRYGFIHL